MIKWQEKMDIYDDGYDGDDDYDDDDDEDESWSLPQTMFFCFAAWLWQDQSNLAIILVIFAVRLPSWGWRRDF